jgi:hypothetical protein
MNAEAGDLRVTDQSMTVAVPLVATGNGRALPVHVNRKRVGAAKAQRTLYLVSIRVSTHYR